MEIAGSNFTSSKSFFTVHYSFGLTRKNDHSFCNVNYYELKEKYFYLIQRENLLDVDD